MGTSATRRIRGKGPVEGREKRRRPERADRGYSIPALVAVSVLLHVVLLLAVDFLPGLFPAREKPVKVYSITMTSLPKGPAGGGGKSTEVEKPPPAPENVKPPEPDKEAVKVAKKTAAKPEAKPAEKKENPKEKPAPAKDRNAPPAKIPTVVPEAPAGPGQGPVGGGRDDQSETGPVTIAGGIEFPFGYYIDAMQKKIGGRWRPPDMSMKKKPKVVVFFRIGRNGRLADIRVEESSGIGMVDRTALIAVRESSPLPPLPDEFDGDSLGVHYAFVVGDRK